MTVALTKRRRITTMKIPAYIKKATDKHEEDH